MVLISIQNEREWAQFCTEFLQQPELPQREGFRLNVDRVANRELVDTHIGETFATLTRDECAARLRAANTAYGFVNGLAEFATHPALRRVTLETPNGPVAVAAPPARFSDGVRELGPVPGIGEHSERIRAEFAG